MIQASTAFSANAAYRPTLSDFRAVDYRRKVARELKWSPLRNADVLLRSVVNPRSAPTVLGSAALPWPTPGKLSPAVSLSIIAGGAMLLWAAILTPVMLLI